MLREEPSPRTTTVGTRENFESVELKPTSKTRSTVITADDGVTCVAAITLLC